MDKVVAYLLEKETITGAEMVAIIEGRDPALVEDEYASTRQETPGIEAPAKRISMISEKIEPPAPAESAGEEASVATAESAVEPPAEEAVSRQQPEVEVPVPQADDETRSV